MMCFDKYNQQKEILLHYILEFEQLERKSYLLSATYIIEFHKEIIEKNRLKFENDGMLQGISMLSNGKTKEEVAEFLSQHRTQYVNYQQKYYQQYNQSKALDKKCSKYAPEDMNMLDEVFLEYCKSNHPLINLNSTEENKSLYTLLITVYRMVNLDGFKGLLKENETGLNQLDNKNIDFESWTKTYKESIENLKQMIINLKNSFPLNKEEIFYKEDALTREQMDLRESNYELREMNKALQKDFLLQFPYAYKL